MVPARGPRAHCSCFGPSGERPAKVKKNHRSMRGLGAQPPGRLYLDYTDTIVCPSKFPRSTPRRCRDSTPGTIQVAARLLQKFSHSKHTDTDVHDSKSVRSSSTPTRSRRDARATVWSTVLSLRRRSLAQTCQRRRGSAMVLLG